MLGYSKNLIASAKCIDVECVHVEGAIKAINFKFVVLAN